MKKLRFLGEYYRGDGIIARTDDIVEIPDVKAEQLLKDFPDEWARAGKRRAAPGKGMRSPKNKLEEPGENKTAIMNHSNKDESDE